MESVSHVFIDFFAKNVSWTKHFVTIDENVQKKSNSKQLRSESFTRLNLSCEFYLATKYRTLEKISINYTFSYTHSRTRYCRHFRIYYGIFDTVHVTIIYKTCTPVGGVQCEVTKGFELTTLTTQETRSNCGNQLSNTEDIYNPSNFPINHCNDNPITKK